jgi:hypothetical protein
MKKLLCIAMTIIFLSVSLILPCQHGICADAPIVQRVKFRKICRYIKMRKSQKYFNHNFPKPIFIQGVIRINFDSFSDMCLIKNYKLFLFTKGRQ